MIMIMIPDHPFRETNRMSKALGVRRYCLPLNTWSPWEAPFNLGLQCPALQNKAMVFDCWFSAEIFDTLVWVHLRSNRIIVS